MQIWFLLNETVLKFAEKYLLQAQILYNAGSLNDFGSCIAMRKAVKPFKDLFLWWIMLFKAIIMPLKLPNIWLEVPICLNNL